MNTSAIRKRLYDYIRVADDKKIKTIYTWWKIILPKKWNGERTPFFVEESEKAL